MMSDLEKYKIDGYYPTIGIECHVQLKTNTKLFAAVGNDAREAEPNTLISHICLGMPGALPVLNEKAVELAARAAFALGTEPQHFSKFDRKHYFYPDLPKGYQITQYDQPIIVGGKITAILNDEVHEFVVARAHLEEDAGKSTHPAGADYSLVDLNRAGTPLLEIVSEPCIHSPEEAKAYAHELYLLMKYAEVSDVNLYYGNMRFDVNVSVSKDVHVLGTRTETKNLNSFRSVYDAVAYEIRRQIDLLEEGGTVIQETRGWNEDKQVTFSQRSKEDAHDYRYFPDPDIPPIELDDKYITAVRDEMPILPAELRRSFAAVGMRTSQIEILLEEPLAAKLLFDIAETTSSDTTRVIGNWLIGPLAKGVTDLTYSWSDIVNVKSGLIKLSDMTLRGSLSSSAAKEVLGAIVVTKRDPEEIAHEKNLLQVSDVADLEAIILEVLSVNEKAAQDVKNGEMKAIGFLVGQVMKASKGKANPSVVQEIIKKHLGA